jgi:lipopolysaccharide export LptBFGC system permease protein LptF
MKIKNFKSIDSWEKEKFLKGNKKVDSVLTIRQKNPSKNRITKVWIKDKHQKYIKKVNH